MQPLRWLARDRFDGPEQTRLFGLVIALIPEVVEGAMKYMVERAVRSAVEGAAEQYKMIF
jgi:hypothetical protein